MKKQFFRLLAYYLIIFGISSIVINICSSISSDFRVRTQLINEVLIFAGIAALGFVWREGLNKSEEKIS